MNGFEPVHERIHAWTDAGQWDDREFIVRCRDCKYYASNMHECMRLDVWDDSLWFPVEQDDFCSFAAKEEQ